MGLVNHVMLKSVQAGFWDQTCEPQQEGWWGVFAGGEGTTQAPLSPEQLQRVQAGGSPGHQPGTPS